VSDVLDVACTVATISRRTSFDWPTRYLGGGRGGERERERVSEGDTERGGEKQVVAGNIVSVSARV
jgi:hypothetical protein